MLDAAAPRKSVPSAPWFGWTLAGAVIVGLLVRAGWVLSVDTQPVTDFHWYFVRGVEISQGRGYQVDGVPTAYWPVGYPAALGLVFWLVGASVAAAKAFGVLLSTSVIALTGWLGKGLLRSPMAGAVAAWLAALYPPFILYSGILASENLYISLSLLAILWSFEARDSWWKWLLAGAAFGLAVLVRPQAILIPLLVVPVLILNDGDSEEGWPVWKALAVALLGLSLVISPWLVRCGYVFGRPVFVSTNGGDNLLIGHSPGATGRYRNPSTIPPASRMTLPEGDRDRASSAQAKTSIVQDPLRSLSLVPAKVWATFGPGHDAAYWAFQKEFGKLGVPGRRGDRSLYLTVREASWWSQVVIGTLGFLGILGMAILKSPKRPRIFTPLAMALITGALAAAFFGNPRFGLPMAPFLLIGLSTTVCFVCEKRFGGTGN